MFVTLWSSKIHIWILRALTDASMLMDYIALLHIIASFHCKHLKSEALKVQGRSIYHADFSKYEMKTPMQNRENIGPKTFQKMYAQRPMFASLLNTAVS